MNEPLVSIICPVFNMSRYIQRCIDSIISQTYTNFELLLIDDGSTDNSFDICNNYQKHDERIKVFRQTNKGVGAARQKGLENASGDYVIHVDPDDWIDKEMLNDLVHEAETSHADIVICDYLVETDKGQFYQKQQPSSLSHDVVLKDIFVGLHGNCWNKLVRRNCFVQYNVRFPEGINFREDFCICVQLLVHPLRVSYLNKAYYHYFRANQSSLTSIISANRLNEQLEVIKIVRTYLGEQYQDYANILEADVACWIIENNLWGRRETYNSFKSVLLTKKFHNLPPKRKIRLIGTFLFGHGMSKLTHIIFNGARTVRDQLANKFK